MLLLINGYKQEKLIIKTMKDFIVKKIEEGSEQLPNEMSIQAKTNILLNKYFGGEIKNNV